MAKVLIFINHSLALYKFRRELPESLLNKKYEVVLVYPNNDKDEFFEKMGCKIIHMPMERKTKNPISELYNIRKFKQICKNEKPDIVLTYTLKCCLYGSFLNKRLKKIATVTGQSSFFKKSKGIKKWIYKLIIKRFRKYNYVFYQNSNDLVEYNKIINKPRKFYELVSGSGVNFEEHPYQGPVPNNPFVFSFVGRIIKEKGINEFLDAIVNIKECNVLFKIAGPCEDIEILKKIQTLHDSRVTYLGDLDNINELYKNSSCIVVPSYSEGMCNALLEAQASGRPVIATNIAGCIETFVDGVSGYSVNSGDSIDLCDAMSKMMKNPEKDLTNMGLEGLKHVMANFSREKVIERYGIIIDSLLVEH